MKKQIAAIIYSQLSSANRAAHNADVAFEHGQEGSGNEYLGYMRGLLYAAEQLGREFKIDIRPILDEVLHNAEYRHLGIYQGNVIRVN